MKEKIEVLFMGKMIDLTGEKFGRLTVLALAEKPKDSKSTSKFWLCKCECGTEKIISGNVLRQGKAKSCGCLNNEMKPSEDLTQKRFGHLTALKRVEKPKELKSHGAYWLCKCDCGKEKIIMGKSLRSGHTLSCGACRTDIVDNLIGNKYSYLTVIERDFSKTTTNNGAFWLCECKCGNKVVVSGKNLKHGNTKSCGCLISTGEEKIKKLLIENNISFKQQYSFPELKSLKGYPLCFDFAIFKEEEIFCLIEYQGQQHYDKTSNWHTKDLEINDNLKKDFCRKKEIQLIELTKSDNLSNLIQLILGGD